MQNYYLSHSTQHPETKALIQEEVETLAKIAQEAARKREMKVPPVKRIYTDFLNLAYEIFAEMFGFCYGFQCNWNLYVERVWTLFSNEYPLTPDYLCRSILVYFMIGPGKNLRKEQIGPEEMTGCLQSIEEIVKKAPTKQTLAGIKGLGVIYASDFSGIAEIVRSFIQRFPIKPAKKDLEYEEVNSCLRIGQIVITSNPLDILLPLFSCPDKVTLTQRFTALLSLYNTYELLKMKSN